MPAILVAGAAFAVPQFLISNYHGPWLVDVGAAVSSMVFLTLFLIALTTRLVRLRGQLMQAAPDGAMAAVMRTLDIVCEYHSIAYRNASSAR